MRRNTRAKMVSFLERRGAVRHNSTGSKSMWECPGGAIVFLRSGECDRERRIATKLRRVDLDLLVTRPGSVVMFLCDRIKAPIVVPATLFQAYVAKRAAAPDHTVSIHLRVESSSDVVFVQANTALHEFVGRRHLGALLPRCGHDRGDDPATHALWQTRVAAIGRAGGLRVYVPENDRLRLDQTIAGHAGLGACDELPLQASQIQPLTWADVVLTEPGARSPSIVCEIEHGGDILAALNRHAHTLAWLREQRAPMPRFVVVADEKRREEFRRKLRPAPLFESVRLPSACAFWSYQEVTALFEQVMRGSGVGTNWLPRP